MVTIPTASELKLRYTEFEPLDEARINIFIEEASRSVDDTWIEDDQKHAIMALTCHLMSLEGEPSKTVNSGSSTVVSSGGVELYLKKRTVGDTSNEYAETSGSVSNGSGDSGSAENDYQSTPYGAKFYKLLKLNHSGMRVV